MKLAILAGGKGTRLGEVDIPKPMVLIGDKPLLQHQIELANRYNIKEIYLLTGYLSDIITSYFGNGKKFGVKIHHIIEEKPLGTAGAIKQLSQLMDDAFLLFNGDNMMDFNIEKFINHFYAKEPFASIIVHPNDHPRDCDIIELNDDGTVEKIYTRPHPHEFIYSNLVNAGVFIFNPSIFKYIPSGKADIEERIFPNLIKSGKSISAYKTSEYIFDVGTKPRLEQAINDYNHGRIETQNLTNPQRAIFIDRDGVINKEINHLNKICDFELLPRVIDALKIINNSKYLSIVITNQAAVAKGILTVEELIQIHKKMETLLGNKNVFVNDIYYCPHHPDTNLTNGIKKFIINCNCRKPKTGMIEKAVKKYNIDLENSFIIGDKTVDIQMGKNAGLKTILVRTGYGGSDNLHDCAADQIFDDLYESVEFIIKSTDG